MLTCLVLGAGIGFVSGVSPGPVTTLVVTETLRGGWLRGAIAAFLIGYHTTIVGSNVGSSWRAMVWC